MYPFLFLLSVITIIIITIMVMIFLIIIISMTMIFLIVIMSMTVVIAGHLDNSPEAREAWSQNKQLSLRLSWLSPWLSTFVFDHFAILRLLCTPLQTWANTPIFLIFPIEIQLCRPGLAMMNCFAIDDKNDNDLDKFPARRAPPPPSHHLFPQIHGRAPLHRFTCIPFNIIITVNITITITIAVLTSPST